MDLTLQLRRMGLSPVVNWPSWSDLNFNSNHVVFHGQWISIAHASRCNALYDGSQTYAGSPRSLLNIVKRSLP
jgi:hypothetical protein